MSRAAHPESEDRASQGRPEEGGGRDAGAGPSPGPESGSRASAPEPDSARGASRRSAANPAAHHRHEGAYCYHDGNRFNVDDCAGTCAPEPTEAP